MVVQKLTHGLIPLGALAAGVLTLLSLRGPAPRPTDAPVDVFSAGRALRHVENIAREPHPVETAAHAAVREYLLSELRGLGLEPRVQSASITRNRNRRVIEIENVLVRLAGTVTGPAVMFTAHYDSVAAGPGAADDGVGVAALLETLRILQQGPSLRRPIIALFSDGEETGLLGARTFVDSDPWKDEVGLVINFEARGNAGPAFMFELSPDNGELVAAFARVAPHPVATSVSDMVYRMMPNDTDFTIYRRAGMAGFNFAFIDGAEHYHQPTDTPENVDLRSLQHTGETALALARYFGNTEELSRGSGDAVFFNLCGSFLAHYPVTWVRPLALLLVALAGAVLTFGGKESRFNFRGVLRPLAGLVVSYFVVAILAAANFGIARVLVRSFGREWLDYSYVFGLLMAVGVTWGIGRRLGRKNDGPAQAAATLILWLVVAVVLAFLLPAASYVVFWPALAGWLALGVLMIWGERAHYLAYFFQGFAAALAAVLVAPLLYYAYVALPFAMPALVVLAGYCATLIFARVLRVQSLK